MTRGLAGHVAVRFESCIVEALGSSLGSDKEGNMAFRFGKNAG
jgi:hypothetical protein